MGERTSRDAEHHAGRKQGRFGAWADIIRQPCETVKRLFLQVLAHGR